MTKEFTKYQSNVIENAKTLAGALMERDFEIVSSGADNHLLLIDLRNKNVTVKEAEHLLVEICITVNKNTVPKEAESPFVTRGIRVGTSATTTRRQNDSNC